MLPDMEELLGTVHSSARARDLHVLPHHAVLARSGLRDRDLRSRLAAELSNVRSLFPNDPTHLNHHIITDERTSLARTHLAGGSYLVLRNRQRLRNLFDSTTAHLKGDKVASKKKQDPKSEDLLREGLTAKEKNVLITGSAAKKGARYEPSKMKNKGLFRK